MSATTTDVVQPAAQSLADRSLRAERLFYAIAGSLMLIMAVVGFRLFILHGKGFGGGELTRQIVPLTVAHGLAMFSWVALFLVQSLLVLTGNRRLHMRIGPAAVLLAPVIVILGASVAALSVHFNPLPYEHFGGPRFFLAIMWGEILSFGALVAIGFSYRSRIEVHRPMMLLATVLITSGSLARLPYIGEYAARPPLYVFGPTLLLGALLFILHWAMTRAASRSFAIGFAGLTVSALVYVAIGGSALWSQFAAHITP